MLEVLVAIVGIAGYPSSPQAGGIPWLISLLGLIYILVRGLDNIDVGIAARRGKSDEPAGPGEAIAVK
ncbi:MAG: hypothetical protein V4564_12165 [Pseudomonadota bacterium]|uniref:hypothetical protein n=1 Tax=Sphingomonas sp. ERG5 TaxID=1381597 RepID=UPI00054B025D|nr:hypothetical protein [Sphingomonas sp. ERG5]